MTLPATKKVTFQETSNQHGQQQRVSLNNDELPSTLNDPNHSLLSAVKFVNPCCVEVAEEEIQPKKNQELDGGTQTQPGTPKEVVCKSPLPSEKQLKNNCPKSTCTVEPERPQHRVIEVAPAHQILSDKLRDKRIEEDFRRENPIMRRELFKYDGICGTLGNPIFTNTPVAPPGYKAKPHATRVPGHPNPAQQHPLYKTTSGEYGSCEPYLGSTPNSFHPRDQSFSIARGIGGQYEDAHLTTEVETSIMW